ncbi:MAG: hypothetical protein M3401_17995 [Actinomycetota bacterium]|nr:hypothetical protein [Actinomycetota bacterium]
MSGAIRRALLLVVLTAALPAAALAQHMTGAPPASGNGADVVVQHSAVDPRRVTVLVGERVGWLNASVRTHTVTSQDGLFDSDRLGPARRFSYTFNSTGSFSYFCRIHPFITGTVNVASLLLHPAGRLHRGEPLALRGRGKPGGGPVTIEQDVGAGFAPLVTVPRAMDGSFGAQLTADQATTFRAVSGGDVSAPVRVEVAAARTVAVSTKRGSKRRIVSVTVKPPLPGSVVHLQRRLRERFGWWTVARHSLSNKGRARFSLRRASKGRYRAMLTKPDGETPAAVSRTLRLRG